EHLIRVTDGHLLLRQCRLTAPGVVQAGGGNLVAFRAAGTRPLEPRPLPGCPPDRTVDRPVGRLVDCLLLPGGAAGTAELGRGAGAMENCVVGSGRDTLVLRPQRVARDRFEADLWLDRCTIVAERSFVRLGPWPGSPAGPDRPWLVSTRGSAFLDAF